ncbi:MAG: recombinase RecA [Chloroflexi bacterium]|nr:recombinase RecA [Chloroflexota bacterium]
MATDKAKDKATDKAKALELAIGQIDRHFGRGTVMKLGETNRTGPVESISTGSISLDMALGIGGIPRGRVVEIFGTEASGKSTLAYHVMASAQRNGGVAAYIDAEHALDPSYAAKCGIDIDELLISQPDTAEQALEICEYLVRSGAVDVVVIDSVAALVPKAELEGDMGDSHMGLQARLMSQGLRKLTSAISRSNTSVIFINQLREKIGVFFGNPEVTPGGKALKFYSSVRIDLRKIESIKQGTEVVGNRVRARIVKNKVAPPFRVAEFDIMFNEGISREGDVIDIGVEKEVVKKSGSFYSFNDIRLGQGRENSKAFLREHREITEQIEALIMGKASAEASVSENGVADTDGVEENLADQPVAVAAAE